MKKQLTADVFESQMVLDLPDRDLLGTLINIHTGPIHTTISNNDVSVLENLLNHSFNNWKITLLSGNDVDVDVSDVLSDNDVNVFCNQVVAVLALQCAKK